MTAEGRARSNENLLRGPSTDPELEARRKRGLRRGNVKHSAYGGERLVALQAKHAEELLRDYPQLDDRRRALLSDRLARIQAASEWMTERGITPPPGHKGVGSVWPVITALEKWACRAEELLAAAEAQAREHAASAGPTLQSILDEYAARRELPSGEDEDGGDA